MKRFNIIKNGKSEEIIGSIQQITHDIFKVQALYAYYTKSTNLFGIYPQTITLSNDKFILTYILTNIRYERII